MRQSCLYSFNSAQSCLADLAILLGKLTAPLNGFSEEVLYKYYVVIIIIIKHEQKLYKIDQVIRPNIPDT